MTAARKILIIDDNRDAADLLRELVSIHGHEAVVAYDGQQGLAAAESVQPEVAFVDLGMPGMDGYELARRLRQNPGGDAIQLIAMTGWGQPADRERVRAAGFNHHLLKPMDLAELVALL